MFAGPSAGIRGSGKGPAAKPQFLVCYLCGQQFGTSSLHIHQPQCYKKKLEQWYNGDPASRGPKPRDPATANVSGLNQKVGGPGGMTMQEFNDQQFHQFTQDMVQCENCGRRFLPDRLVVHQRSCKPGNAAKGVSRPPPLASRNPPAGSAVNAARNISDSGPRQQYPGSQKHDSSPSSQIADTEPKLPAKLRALRQTLFDDVDSNSDGKIDMDELRSCAKEVDPSITDGELQQLIRALDLNKDGIIDQPEWNIRHCHSCRATESDPAARFCGECGTQLKPFSPKKKKKRVEVKEITCSSCATVLSANSKFCSQCGTKTPSAVTTTIESDDNDEASYEDEDDSYQSEATGANHSSPPARPSARKSGTGASGGSIYNNATAHPEAFGGIAEEDRVECSMCGRRFAPEVVARHEQICSKTKQRKPMNVAKQRLAGLDVTRPSYGAATATAVKPDWKKKSEEFRATMRAARQVDSVLKAGGTAKDLPPPTYSDNSHLTPCPHCGRRFNEKAAERHIPSCARTINKPKPPPRRR